MTTRVTVEIDVDDEYADDEHRMGMTEAGYEALADAINSVGSIADGPTKVG